MIITYESNGFLQSDFYQSPPGSETVDLFVDEVKKRRMK